MKTCVTAIRAGRWRPNPRHWQALANWLAFLGMCKVAGWVNE